LVELTSGRSIAIKGFKHELNAYREETVYIYPYMTTALRAGEYAFTEEDFIADLYFTGTAVIDPYSTGTDTYKATKVHILKAVDNDRNMIANDQQDFESQLITEASIDDNGNWELYLPSNLIADDIKAPFTFFTDGKYHRSAGYPVYFSFTMQSQQNPANTMQSRWVRQEIVNKHGKRDIALEAKIRKITIQGNWGTVEGNSAIRTSAGYDVVYADDLDNRIILTVNTANSGIMRDTVKVKKSGGDDLTVVEDELDVVSNPESVFITFKMPDDDVTVSAQFFIPEGNVLVHAADNSSGGYTARQVFVWLDANQDGKPDSDLPVNRGPDGRSDDYVNGGEWKFTLPSEHQAYSGAFLFQFRLTRTGKSDILSRQFPVNVSELASDIDNRISLPVEIRTLVTDTAGKGNITITVPNMRGEDGNLVESPSIASGDYAAVDTDLRVTVIPTGADYLSGLHYAQTGSLNGTPAELYASGDGGKIYAFTMPSYNTTVTAEFRDFAVGDTGPAGGLIFYVEQNGSQVTSQGWKYLEAAPTDALSPYAESGTISWMSLPYSEPGYPQSYYLVDTYSYIGAGKQNTVNMIQAVVTGGGEFLYSYFENGAAKACDIFTYDGYEDWFLPSKDDLAAMYTELKGNSLGNFTNGLYWSSTASDLENAYAIDFSSVENDPNDATETKEKHHEYLYVRPIRAF
ncbi:MAG: DUF1566 domain-containing protein, partial [Treponema sp.]|nr:DUF1566 domain-containing protein [Treponema sp.]